MEQFIKDQTRLHPFNTVRQIYQRTQDFTFGYYVENYYQAGDKVSVFTNIMATKGAVAGQFTSPGFGQLFSENRPNLKYTYIAICPRMPLTYKILDWKLGWKSTLI